MSMDRRTLDAAIAKLERLKLDRRTRSTDEERKVWNAAIARACDELRDAAPAEPIMPPSDPPMSRTALFADRIISGLPDAMGMTPDPWPEQRNGRDNQPHLFVEQMLKAFARPTMTASVSSLFWVPLVTNELPNGRGKLLVTNSIKARNARGQYSHLWVVDMLHYSEDLGVYAFDDNHQRCPSFLTHYIALEDVLPDGSGGEKPAAPAEPATPTCTLCDGKGEVEQERDETPSEATGGQAFSARSLECPRCNGSGKDAPAEPAPVFTPEEVERVAGVVAGFELSIDHQAAMMLRAFAAHLRAQGGKP